jgi:hypothetical protein
MDGPEHYQVAEALLDSCRIVGGDDLDDRGRLVPTYPATEWDRDRGEVNTIGNALAAAQVHATLALAAATAAEQATAYDGDETHARSRGWAGAT